MSRQKTDELTPEARGAVEFAEAHGYPPPDVNEGEMRDAGFLPYPTPRSTRGNPTN